MSLCTIDHLKQNDVTGQTLGMAPQPAQNLKEPGCWQEDMMSWRPCSSFELGCVNASRSHREQESGTKEFPACSTRLRAPWAWRGPGMGVWWGCEISVAATVHTDHSRPLEWRVPDGPVGPHVWGEELRQHMLWILETSSSPRPPCSLAESRCRNLEDCSPRRNTSPLMWGRQLWQQLQIQVQL